MSKIPVIDVSCLAQNSRGGAVAAKRDLISAFTEVGFVGLLGHGLPNDLIVSMRDQTRALFDLSKRTKLKYVVKQDNYRGYIPLGFFTPNMASDMADQYEGYKLHHEVQANDPLIHDCDLYGPNRWPAQLPELANVVRDYWSHCDRIAMSLISVLAESMGVPALSLQTKFEQPLTNMTLLHYPAMADKQNSDTDSFGIHPHKDTDVLTLLAPDRVGGLYLRPRNSQKWIEAEVPDGGLICNVGDMLETWSNGRFVSTPHMVINRTGAERYSFPYFAVPRHDVEITPIKSADTNAGAAAAIEWLPSLGTAGDISRQIWYSNWPDSQLAHAQLDPYAR